MKRLFLAILFLSFFGFSSSVLASYSPTVLFTNYDPDLTFVYYGINVDTSQPFVYLADKAVNQANVEIIGYGIIGYHPDYGLKVNTNNPQGIDPVPSGQVYQIFEYNGTNWVQGGNTYYHLNNNISLDSQIATTGNVYCGHPMGLWFLGDYYAGDSIMLSSNFNDVLPENYTLSITRSPEVGGGVSDYPAGENILCGIDSYEICEESFPLNTEVTLDASPNDGYAFSHWEINDLAMLDVDGSIDVTMSEDKDVTAVYYLDMKLPLTGGKSWLLYVEAGGEVQCGGGTDPYHTNASYHSFDFTDNTLEDGHLEGTDVPILAALGGVVYFAGGDPNDNGYGYNVVIDHGNGYKTRYAHLKNEPTASGTVLQGEQIGIMGNTGNSTGIHLHFQVYHDDDSSVSNEALLSVHLDGYPLNHYQVGCSSYNPPTGFYYSSNL